MIEVYIKKLEGVWFGVACEQQQIVAASFGLSEQVIMSNMLAILPFNKPFQGFVKPSAFAEEAFVCLKKVYDGKDISDCLPLAYAILPDYTQKVLKATLQIPLGYVASYGAISDAVGGSPRAVGNVMASNPFAPIVPCHRVVKSDFSLGGYGGGLKVKVELLGRESRGFSTSKQVQVGGGTLTVFPVENVLRNLV
ncbi:MAG: MGMT family protein [Candidatus Bathyarchaeia archaeon]|jgi:O-6-methylguanine DNA methyltransferase